MRIKMAIRSHAPALLRWPPSRRRSPQDPPVKPSRDIARLIEIMAALRTPGTGCPWDLEQNFATIAPYTLEEAYEVADAIARDDLADLKDELGDLLLQVVFHARMAEEQGAFDFGDVVEAITAKLIRRHPHVFGDAQGRRRRRSRAFGSASRPRRRRRRPRAAKRAQRRRARRRAGRPARPHPRAEAAGQGRPGRLRLERSARRARQDPRGSRRDRSRARDAGDKPTSAAARSRRSAVRRGQPRPPSATPTRKLCCARPTRNSSAALPRIERALAARGKRRRTRRSPRWTRSGTRRRRRRSPSLVARGSESARTRNARALGRCATSVPALARTAAAGAVNFARTALALSASARTVMAMRPVSRRSPCASLRCGDAASSRRRRRPDRARDRARRGRRRAAPRSAAARRIDPLPGQRRHQHRPLRPPAAARRDFRAARAPAASSRSILFHTSISAPASFAGIDAELAQHLLDVMRLRLGVLVRDVAHVQDHVGLDHLLERGAERRHQHGRQVGDEADRVGQDRCARRAAGRPRAASDRASRTACRRDSTLRLRHAVEQRRLAGVGVADQRHDRVRHALAARRDAACACA